jgi:hypothetical protein
MQTHLDHTPPDGDFVAYIESLSSHVKPPTPASPSNPHVQDLSPSVQDIVNEVFKRRPTASTQSAVDKLDEIQRERQGSDPFTEPQDAWEARWQPVFQLVNAHRWLLLALVFFAYTLISISKRLLLPLLGLADAGDSYELFGMDDLDAPLMGLFFIISAAVFGYLMFRLNRLARQASLQHAASPQLFWIVLAALAMFEWMMSSSSHIGSVFFWLSLVLGTVNGALWRVVRGLRRGYLLLRVLMSDLRS